MQHHRLLGVPIVGELVSWPFGKPAQRKPENRLWSLIQPTSYFLAQRPGRCRARRGRYGDRKVIPLPSRAQPAPRTANAASGTRRARLGLVPEETHANPSVQATIVAP